MDDVEPKAMGEEALANLMRMVAHDGNNLLFMALASLEIAEDRDLPQNRRSAALEKARENALSASRLNTNVLRAVEAMSAGRSTTWFDLGASIREAAEATRRDVPDRPLGISTEGPLEGTAVLADHMLKDALSEIFRNSLVHSPDGEGAITVTLGKDGGDLLVAIEDMSGGMDPEKACLASERLRTAIGTGDHHGSGIGLSMVGEVMRSYGWTLSFERVARNGPPDGLRAVLRVPDQGWRGG